MAEIAEATQPLAAAFAKGASGPEIVATYLGIWEDAAAGAAMRAILRTAIGSDKAVALLQGAVMQGVLEAAPARDRLGAELAVMQLIALGLGRHIVGLPDLKGRSIEDIAARVRPVIAAYLGTADR